MNFPKSVNAIKFVEYLREWRQMHPDELLAIFVDRLNVHRSARVTEALAELGIERILNCSY